jgi:hypothetical protein
VAGSQVRTVASLPTVASLTWLFMTNAQTPLTSPV